MRKPKKCPFCHGADEIDYKDSAKLRRFTTDRGKLLARRITGVCARHQRKVTRAVKRARIVGLLPFIGATRR